MTDVGARLTLREVCEAHPLDVLRFYVTGAIERGEKEPIVAIESVESEETDA